jgi:hypothetical protein
MTDHDHLTGSLEAVQQALVHLRDGLLAGGFAAALETYWQMTEVVMAQRMTVLVDEDTRFSGQFEAIATTAAQIRNLLAPWLPLMERLASMDSLSQEVARELVAADPSSGAPSATGSATSSGEGAEEEVMRWLRAHPGPQPTSRVRAGVPALTSDSVTQALDHLVAEGAVIPRRVGHRSRWEAAEGGH